MSPSRRTLLRSFGVALTGAVGGCLSSSGTDPTTETESAEPTTTATSNENGPPTVREVDGVDRKVPNALVVESSGEPSRAFAVGSRENVPNPDDEKPHVLAVWNDIDLPLSVDLTLSADGSAVLDDHYDLALGAHLAFELREPRSYELTVRPGDREETVAVERDRFDCNDSATDVAVREDEIAHSTITTELACKTTMD